MTAIYTDSVYFVSTFTYTIKEKVGINCILQYYLHHVNNRLQKIELAIMATRKQAKENVCIAIYIYIYIYIRLKIKPNSVRIRF